MTGRIPTHLEVAGLLRAMESRGGFGTVLRKGDADSGAILVLTIERQRATSLWERLPRRDGIRAFALAKREDTENKQELSDYLGRRMNQDSDLWLIELDGPEAERLVAEWY